jgi:hypothetical protein
MNMDFTMCLEILVTCPTKALSASMSFILIGNAEMDGPDFELFSGNYRTRRDIDKKSFFWCKIGQTKTNDCLGQKA